MNLLEHLRRQREWSESTFGPGNRTQGVLDHIRKELGAACSVCGRFADA